MSIAGSALKIGYASSAGSCKDVNQDAALVLHVHDAAGNEYALVAVCDGVGGLELGERVSGAVCSVLARWFTRKFPSLAGVALTSVDADASMTRVLNGAEDYLRGLITDTNESLLRYSAEQRVELGTTLCAFLCLRPARDITSKWLACVIGDSRLYQLKFAAAATDGTAAGSDTISGFARAVASGEPSGSDTGVRFSSVAPAITQLSTDQTLAELSVAERVRYGEEIARLRGMDESQVLSQCLGLTENIQPVFLRGSGEPGSAYLLCSDGFRHKLGAEEMLAGLLPQCDGERQSDTGLDPRQRAAQSTSGADRKATKWLTTEDLNARLESLIQTNIERGEQDNITAVLVEMVNDAQSAAVQTACPNTAVSQAAAAKNSTPSNRTTEVFHA